MYVTRADQYVLKGQQWMSVQGRVGRVGKAGSWRPVKPGTQRASDGEKWMRTRGNAREDSLHEACAAVVFRLDKSRQAGPS